MNQTENKPHSTPSKKSSRLAFLIALTLSISVITGCATSRSTRDKAHDVLSEQTKLLEAIQTERRTNEIATRIEKDPALSAAEHRLMTAIDMLKQSNASVQGAL